MRRGRKPSNTTILIWGLISLLWATSAIAAEKISDLTALTSPASDDLLVIVDVSDTTMAPSGTTKKITTANLLAGIAAQNLWETIVGNSGSVAASSPTDTLSVLGSGQTTTSISGHTLTISTPPPAFSAITSGSNTSAVMTVNSGASLGYLGSGIINASQYRGVTTIDGTEFGHLDGVTSSIQAQLNAKQTSHAYLTDIAGITANQGDVIFYNGSHWVDLAPGTSGQFLKTQGSGANPVWASVPGGSVTFDSITSGTNTTATMTVGAGGTLTYTSTGVVNANRFQGVTTVDATEFGYLDGVTSSIQAQLNAKQTSHAYLTDIAGITANQGDVIFYNGSHWVDLAPGTAGHYLQTQGAGANPIWAAGLSSGAPSDATYITQTANGTLTNEQALGSLATGLLKNTTTTGVLSIATQGADYYAPGGTDVAVADGGTGRSSWELYAIPYLSGTSTFGYISRGPVNTYLKVNSSGTGYEWGTPSTVSFDGITSGSNTSAVMTINSGATLGYLGSGIINANRFQGVTTVDATEFGYLNGVTSAIQTQFGNKQPLDADLTAIAAIVGTQGDIIFHNGTQWVDLAPGTSGQFLKTQGSGANPVWASVSTGGGGYTINADNYGTHGTQAAITAAIAAAASAGGGTVFIPAGLWNITSTISITSPGIVLLGEKGGTILRRNAAFTTGHTIDINGTYQCGVRDMDIQCYSATMTDYAHIRLYSAQVCDIRNVYVQDGYYGIYIHGGEENLIDGVVIQTVYKTASADTNTGIYVYGTDGPYAKIANTTVTGGGTGSSGSPYYAYQYGIRVFSADLVAFSNCYVAGCRHADVQIVASSGVQLTGVTFDGCFFDAPNGPYYSGTFSPYASVYISGNSGSSLFGMLTFNNCQFHGTAVSNGLHIESGNNVNMVLVNGCQFYRYQNYGIYIYGGYNIDIKNNTVTGCNQSSGGYDGIYAYDTTRLNLFGNNVGGDWNSPTTVTQVCGIRVSGSRYFTIMGNNLLYNSYALTPDTSGAGYMVIGNLTSLT